jgi:hypothetical protein
MARKRVGALISGRGSNLQTLIDACEVPSFPAEIVLVISNVLGAAGLARAKAAGIPTLTIDHTDFASRGDFDTALDAALTQGRVELLCSTFTLPCFPPSLASTPINGSSTQVPSSAAAPYTSSAPRWIRDPSSPRPRCRCSPTIRPRRLRPGCFKPSIAFILMRLHFSLQAPSASRGSVWSERLRRRSNRPSSRRLCVEHFAPAQQRP